MRQPTGKNITKYATLSGVDAIGDGTVYQYDPDAWLIFWDRTEEKADSVPVQRKTDNANELISIPFNKNFIKNYTDYAGKEDTSYQPKRKVKGTFITYKNNTSLQNPDGSRPLYGEMTLKPVFSHINAKVTVKAPGDNFGYINISGTDYKLNPGESIDITDKYHLGDNLSVSTVIEDRYKDSYSSPGYNIQYKVNGSERAYYDETNYYVNGAPASVDKGRLASKEIIITPIYQEKTNKITVRVKNSDIEKFDAGYGVFQSARTEAQTIGGISYTDYIYADTNNTVSGKLYPVPARAKDENANVCVWKEANNNKKYI